MKQHEKIMTAIVTGLPPVMVNGKDIQEKIRNRYITYYTKLVETNLSEYSIMEFKDYDMRYVFDFFSFLCANGFFTLQAYFRENMKEDGLVPIDLKTVSTALKNNSLIFNGKEYRGFDLKERVFLNYRNNVKYQRSAQYLLLTHKTPMIIFKV